MPGIEAKRFVGLDSQMARHLSCGKCLKVLVEAVDTKCDHTFCRSCIDAVIDGSRPKSADGSQNESTGQLVCPELDCGREWTVSRESGSTEWKLKKNRRINDIIGELKIRCDSALKGCEEVVEFRSLSAHLKKCRFVMCEICDLPVGDRDTHDCIHLLKRESQVVRKESAVLVNDLKKAKDMHKVMTEAERQMRASLNNMEKHKNENQSLKTENQSLKTENQSLKTEIQSLKTDRSDQSLRADNQSLKAETQKLIAENDCQKNEITSLKDRNQHLAIDLQELRNQMKTIASEPKRKADPKGVEDSPVTPAKRRGRPASGTNNH